MEIENREINVGVILKLSNRWVETQSLVEVVKSALVAVATHLSLDGNIYIYQSKNEDFPRTQGESVFQIENFQIEPVNVDFAFKKTLNLLQNQELDRYLWLITDEAHTIQENRLTKALKLNQAKYKVPVYLFNLGAKSEKFQSVSWQKLKEVLIRSLNGREDDDRSGYRDS